MKLLLISLSFVFFIACTDYVAEIDNQIEEIEAMQIIDDEESSSSESASSSSKEKVSSSSKLASSCSKEETSSSSRFVSSSSKDVASSSSKVKSSSSSKLSSSSTSPVSSNSELVFNSNILYRELVDSRDKHSYATVIIGDQLWMAENLDFRDTICVPELKTQSGCYGNDIENCKKYGSLYTASVAFETCTDSSTSSIQGLCPDYWHVPTSGEWKKMVEYVASIVGKDKVGNSLKSLNGWNLNGEGSLGTDDFGFRVLPAGIKNEFGKSEELGQRGAFWTSYFMTGSADTYELAVAVRSSSKEEVAEFKDRGRYYSYSLSIRCISDSLVCGSSVYDVNKDFCFENDLYPLCKGNNYNPLIYTCVKDSIVKIGNILSSSSKPASSSSKEVSSSSSKPASSSSKEVSSSSSKPASSSSKDVLSSSSKPASSSSKIESSSSSVLASSSSEIFEKCGTKEYDPSIKFCFENTVYSLCNGKTYDPSEYVCSGGALLPLCGTKTYDVSKEFCSSNAVYSLCGEKSYDVENEFCYERVVYSKCNGMTYDPNLKICIAGTLKDLCGNTTYVPSDDKKCEDGILFNLFEDARDGIKYRYVSIDTFIVMADNLNYSDSIETPNMLERSSCYDNNEANCDEFGRLYTWTAVMDLANSYVVNKYNASNKHQGICPSGWHIPSMTEWQELYEYAQKKNKNTPYNDLKTTMGWKTAGTNSYGFSAKPGGYYSMSVGRYYEINESVGFWSTTEYSGNSAYYFKISNSGVSSDLMSKWQQYYIRCFKNKN